MILKLNLMFFGPLNWRHWHAICYRLMLYFMRIFTFQSFILMKINLQNMNSFFDANIELLCKIINLSLICSCSLDLESGSKAENSS